MRKVAVESINYGWKRKSVKLLMTAAFIQSIFMAWGFYASQKITLLK